MAGQKSKITFAYREPNVHRLEYTTKPQLAEDESNGSATEEDSGPNAHEVRQRTVQDAA